MKYSQFNTLVPYKNNFVFHNSFTNKFLYLNPLLKELIEASKNENNINELKNIHIELYNSLVNLGFLIEAKTDEIQKVKELIHTVDYNDEEYYLIVNPTMNCNFDCWYCYETHEKKSRVSDTSLDRIKLFISNIIQENKKLKRFTIQFFGGEPLLYFKKTILPIMKLIYQITKKNNIKLSINFTTNGYLINNEMIEQFVKYEVNGLQITFDGNKENHNKVRFVSKSRGSYDKIVENIKKLVKNNINITFRINYTKQNLVGLDNIFDDFKDLSMKERGMMMLSMNKVWEEKSNYLGKRVLLFKDKAKSFGFKLPDSLLSDRVRHSCYADKFNQATINYNGDVYKCNAREFDKKTREGVLNNDGYIEWNKKRDNRMNAKLKNKSCLECKILPICGGGCSQQAIEYQERDYCVNDYDDAKKDDIVLSMFLSKNLENV